MGPRAGLNAKNTVRYLDSNVRLAASLLGISLSEAPRPVRQRLVPWGPGTTLAQILAGGGGRNHSRAAAHDEFDIVAAASLAVEAAAAACRAVVVGQNTKKKCFCSRVGCTGVRWVWLVCVCTLCLRQVHHMMTSRERNNDIQLCPQVVALRRTLGTIGNSCFPIPQHVRPEIPTQRPAWQKFQQEKHTSYVRI